MSKFIVAATWDDVPHLTDQEKEEQLQAIPVYQRDARTKGVPYLGAGAIYPFAVPDIRVKDFDIPKHWPRGYGMDVGWNRTAAIWGALDRDTDTIFLYSVHSRGHAEPEIHAAAIKARGEWIPGRIDPAANGRSQIDGRQLMKLYVSMGLELSEAPNAVEAGIYAMTMRFGTGRLKVFASCSAFWEEISGYSRDDKGKIKKENDHVMDAARYFVEAVELDGNWITTKPIRDPDHERERMVAEGGAGQEWMGG